MQSRYLALWHPGAGKARTHLHEQAGCTDVSVTPIGEQAALWSNQQTPLTWLEENKTIVIGHLHDRPGVSQIAAWLMIAPQSLCRRKWGAYLHFSLDGSGVTAFRSPMGAMPTYYCPYDDGWAIASDVDLLVAMDILRPKISQGAVADYLSTVTMEREDTCIDQVRELPAGCSLHLECRVARPVERVWSLWDHVAPCNITFPDAATELRSIIGSTSRAMFGQYQNVAISVSGGLDSSIVAASLAEGGLKPTVFTFVGADGDADETVFSRPLAHHLGLDLRETPFDPADIDLQRSSASHLPRPIGHAHAQCVAATCRRLQSDHAIDAIFTGMGGDNIFCSNLSALPLVDLFAVQGLTPRLVSTTAALRTITAAKWSEIIGQAVRIARHGRRTNRRPPVRHLLRQDLRDRDVDPLAASWLRPPKPQLPGKAYHAEMVSQAIPVVEGFDRSISPAWCSPLLAQPVVEFCLSIPSWEWSTDGQTRSLARAAFRPLLPAIVVDRRSKGGPDSVSRDLAIARRGELRDILLGGTLLREHILDRGRLEEALSERSLLVEGGHTALLYLADVEAWIARWSELGTKSARTRASFNASHRANSSAPTSSGSF